MALNTTLKNQPSKPTGPAVTNEQHERLMFVKWTQEEFWVQAEFQEPGTRLNF